MTSEKHIPYII